MLFNPIKTKLYTDERASQSDYVFSKIFYLYVERSEKLHQYGKRIRGKYEKLRYKITRPHERGWSKKIQS